MTGTDPRQSPDLLPPPGAVPESPPLVARKPEGPSGVIIFAAFVVAGLVLFLALNAARTGRAEASTLVSPAAGAIASPAEPALVLPVKAMPSPAPAPLPPAPAYVPPPPMAAPILPPPAMDFAPQVDPLQRRRAPSVVIDLGPQPLPQSQGVITPAAPMQPARAAETPPANPAEAFAARLAGSADTAVATAMRSPGFTVPQGAIIPAVLETAINSDLPGYTRALVSRDVRSFDGRTVLIPRGSRLIGQYKSAVSLGQSRAFVIWTRVTRPDGVSVDIGSPGADELGRGGLEGEVDRHFFNRFGGSILLSVLNGIVASIGGNSSTVISIGSPVQAASAAASAQFGDNISPTVKVPQGEAIRIFVARDLDFSLVGAMK